MQLAVHEVVAVTREFLTRLEADRSSLNALNVFPVADNDTGTNMCTTVASICAALDGVVTLDTAAQRVESAALEGRGNSGLIVGQFLAGFCSAFDDEGVELARGVAEGARRARRAVVAPVEGTMLTVADVAAATVGNDAAPSLDVLVGAVAHAVQETPSQLAVLAERNVVDAGAAGLALFFQAVQTVSRGDAALGSTYNGPDELIECDVGVATASHGASAEMYEVQFRVSSSVVADQELRALLGGLGSDVVVASSADEIAAHVHVRDPHLTTNVISAALEQRPGARAIRYDVEPIIESGGPA